MSKVILVADGDPQAAAVFSQALGEQWVVVPALNGADALKLLQEQPCQVVVANVDLAGIDGAELLNRIRCKYPKMVRFMASRDDDKQRVIKTARGAHQFLSKPYDAAAIKDAIERALALDVWVASERVRETIARIRTLPTMPTLYVEVVAALKSPDATTEQVGAIIAKDMAMMTKMLQLLNSACFGLTREITDPAEAVGILGFETVKTMVMTIKLLNQYDKLRASEFSIDRLWQHSTAVGRIARQLTLLETGDRGLADAAFTAGLLHDLGKVVLAANFEDSYSGALLLGAKQNLTAWEVEKTVYGANHGEIGAYLLGLWGMPLILLEATALHHEPSRSTNTGFSPLTAVHVANVFEREVSPDDLGMISPKLDEAYLERLDLLNRVPVWREKILGQVVAKVETKVKVAAPAKGDTVPLAKLAAAPARIEPEPIPDPLKVAEPAGSLSSYRWLFASAGAGLILFATWFMVATPTDGPQSAPSAPAAAIKAQPVSGKTAVGIAANAVPPTNEPVKAAVKPADSAAEGNPVLSVFSPTIVRARTTTNEPAPAVLPKAPAQPEFKLSGILFTPGDPCAFLNGKTVRPNDRIGGATVVAITASNVTIEVQQARKVLTVAK